MDRFELNREYKNVLSKADKMTVSEWEKAYTSMHEICNDQTHLNALVENEIERAYGKAVLFDIANSAAKGYLEIRDMEEESVEKLTPEQEKILDDLF